MSEAGNLGGSADAVLYRLRMLEENQRNIAESLKALVRLEQHHADTRDGLARAWRAIEADRRRLREIDDQIPDRLGERLGAIEETLPTLKLTSKWVIMFTLGGFALAAALVWNSATTPRQVDYAIDSRRPALVQPSEPDRER